MVARADLIGLIVWLVIAIVVALVKKAAGGKTTGSAPPPEPRPRGRAPEKTWEEELRDLLQTTQAPLPSRRQPPPMPRPTYQERASTSDEEGFQVQLPPPHPRVEPQFQPLPGITVSSQRYAEAATLQERVAAHMQDVTRHPVALTVVERRKRGGAEARELVKDRTALRNAFIASVILGPPKGLETGV